MERDRSEDLYKLFQSCRSSKVVTEPREVLHSTNEVRQFSLFAQAFSRNIASVSTVILQLTEISGRRNIFDDQSAELTRLTHVVKTTLQKLHQDLEELEALKSAAVQSQRRAPVHDTFRNVSQRSAEKHSETVVQSLKSKLAKTGQEFRIALQNQSQSMKTNSSRRQHFSSSDQPQSFESVLNQETEQYQQQVTVGNVQYNRQRMQEAMQIESAVAEVNALFNDFTRLVHEQDDVIVRIDANVDDSLRNVNAGNNELLRYLAHLSSNRGLILKILGFLFMFLLFFGFVVVR